MKYVKHLKYICFFSLLSLSLLSSAWAASQVKTAKSSSAKIANSANTVQLHIPDKVAQGSVVKVRVFSETEFKNLTLNWLDKKIKLPLIFQDGIWSGLAILPMPLKAKKAINLSVYDNKQKLTSKNIEVQNVKWPQQQIQVNQKYVTPPQEVQDRIMEEQTKSRSVIASISPFTSLMPNNSSWAKPVPGDITSAFGGQRVLNGTPRSQHKGVDLRGATGTPIKALLAGTVQIADNFYFSGNVVYLDHGQGIISMYGHMDKMLVKAGDEVKAGQKIGLVGATGRVTGPHLHLSVFILGEAVNPMNFIHTLEQQ